MFVTPGLVVPLFEDVVPPVHEALCFGIEYADGLQPGRVAALFAEGGAEPPDVDQHFWAHSARFRAKRHLVRYSDRSGWTMNPEVPNSGIHLCVDTVHKVRVLRSFGGDVPHPGTNKRRRSEWTNGQIAIPLGVDRRLPPLTMILDWQERGTTPILHLSLPKNPWDYGTNPDVWWRVPITGNAEDDLAHLGFNTDDDPDTFGITLKIDPSEAEGAG